MVQNPSHFAFKDIFIARYGERIDQVPVRSLIEAVGPCERRCECADTSPSEESATKLLWLVLQNVQKRWKSPPISWQAAKAQMAIEFEDRFLLTD